MRARPLIGAALGAVLAAGLAGAQSARAPDDALPPPVPSLGPVVAPPPMAPQTEPAPSVAEVEKPRPKPPEPTGPPRAERSPTAILRVLDKVTAQTLRFEAPVGRRVRFKGLVFEVRACQTWAAHSADPRSSAYLIIQSDLGAAAGAGASPREVFRGWMFAEAPGVHALQHPIYDAWVEACAGAPAPTA